MRSIFRRTPMALLNVLQFPVRTAVSAAGVTFALLLVFMQLGFLGAVSNTATILYNQLDFDIVIRSPDYLHLYETRNFDQNWLTWCKGQTDIAEVKPFWVDLMRWQNPVDHRFRAIALLSYRLDQPVFLSAKVLVDPLTGEDNSHWLHNPRNLLIDSATRKDFGPKNGKRYTAADIGTEVMLNNQRVRIAGLTDIGTGLATNGQALISHNGFAKSVAWNAQKKVSLGLVRLRPGADADAVARRLNALVKGNNLGSGMVEFVTRKDAIAIETRRWIRETPIGIIFQMGVLLALMVGTTVVYQVLATDVANRMPEYATLKAMGYSPYFLSKIVLTQALYLAILSFLPAWLLAEALYRITTWAAGVQITMTYERILFVAVAGILICVLSGIVALRKLQRAEPASLF